jgi:hypothetical protein
VRSCSVAQDFGAAPVREIYKMHVIVSNRRFRRIIKEKTRLRLEARSPIPRDAV